jgi:hypothetical protein
MPSRFGQKRPLAIVALVAIATLLAGLIAELFLRWFVRPPEPLGRLSYAMANGEPIAGLEEGVARGFIIPVPGELPRFRYAFAPDTSFFLCYTDAQRLRRDWFDPQGRVPVRFNHFGLRERPEIVPTKPAGQRRIVCIGDSFTFGWGIPEELGWVRLLEDELRRGGTDLRTVNCGAAGTVCIDEYVVGLQQRFHVFGPDMVILTICLNDLIPSSGLNFPVAPPSSGSRLIDLARGAFGRDPLDLDPSRDWVQELLDLPIDEANKSGLADDHQKPAQAMWSTGVPQRYLRECKAWCEARKVPFLVVLWPFLQGLGKGRHYPFQKLHDLVAADCRAADIPFADVTPALRDTPHEDLWVTPADPHANPLAQRLALPTILALVQQHRAW